MKKFFILIAAFILSGCSQVTEHFNKMSYETSKHMTYVLPAGFKIKDEDKTVLAFGRDTCPSASPVMTSLYGNPSDSGTNTCVVVTPSTDSVIVGLIKNKELVYEQWDVIRDNPNKGSILLRRPNGNFVISEQS